MNWAINYPAGTRLNGMNAAIAADEHNSTAGMSDLWMDDGNIIIQVKNMQYKVHRGTLARHSPFFKDMFALPQPDAADMCPIIVLSDEVEDVDYMLRSFYGEVYVALRYIWIAIVDQSRLSHYKESAPLDWRQVGTLVRMGRKYLIAPMFHEAVRRLHFEFPSVWDGFVRVLREVDEEGDLIKLDAPSPFAELLRLCLEHDVLIVAPLLFLLTCTRVDDTERLLALPQPILLRVLEGRKHFAVKIRDLYPILEQTCNSRECTSLRWHRLLEFTTPCSEPPEQYMLFARALDEYTPGVCLGCHERIREDFPKISRRIWNDLPEMFGLPPWEDLKRGHMELLKLQK
jgi:hypothetical protein